MALACVPESAQIESGKCLPGTEKLTFGITPAVDASSPDPDAPEPLQTFYERINRPLVPGLSPAQLDAENFGQYLGSHADEFYTDLVARMKKQLRKPTQAYLRAQCLKSGEKLRQGLLTSVVPESSDEGYSYELPEDEGEDSPEEEPPDSFIEMNAGLDRTDLATLYARTINRGNGLETPEVEKSLRELRRVIDANKARSAAQETGKGPELMSASDKKSSVLEKSVRQQKLAEREAALVPRQAAKQEREQRKVAVPRPESRPEKGPRRSSPPSVRQEKEPERIEKEKQEETIKEKVEKIGEKSRYEEKKNEEKEKGKES